VEEEEEEILTQSKKQAELDKLEQQWKSEQRKSSGWWFWSPFTSSFPSNVTANIQVNFDLWRWTMTFEVGVYCIYCGDIIISLCRL